MASEHFTKEHEWIRVEGDIGTVGITAHAQEQLGDIVFVELPEIGRRVAQGEAVATVESVKAAGDIFAPLAGEVTEVNPAITDQPGLINVDAEGRAWLFKVRIADAGALAALMDRAAYDAYVKETA